MKRITLAVTVLTLLFFAEAVFSQPVLSATSTDKCRASIGKAAGKYLSNTMKAMRKCMDKGGGAAACLGSVSDAKASGSIAKARAKSHKLILKRCGGFSSLADVQFGLGYGAQCLGTGKAGVCDFAMSGVDVAGADNDLLECLDCLHDYAANCLNSASYNSGGASCF
ncbi:MAG: hypothetical protein ACE5E4_08185 [Candidatus Binatia bacterium]